MDVKRKLEALLQYYQSTKGVGHTTAIVEGFGHYDRDVVLLSHTARFSSLLAKRGRSRASILPVGWYDSRAFLESLAGRRLPLVIDNGAMVEILKDALGEIERLECELSKAREMCGD